MITVAIDAATDRLSVAASGANGPMAEQHLLGARRHAGALIPLLEAVLDAGRGSPDQIGRVVVADGPGSFTGLRVAAAAAKGLLRGGDVQLLATPSLLACAWRAGHQRFDGLVLAVAPALRGELYAGWYRVTGRRAVRVEHSAEALGMAQIERGPPPALVAGIAPDGMLDALAAHWRVPLAAPASAAADARTLIELLAVEGGTAPIADPAEWEPAYGRPAEAQARWEREHGRPLPDSFGDRR